MTTYGEKNSASENLEDILYSCPGRITDKTNAWKFIPSANPGGSVYNEAEGYYPDKGGQLLGPSVPTCKNEFEFYSISFDAKAAEDCHWGVFFHDKEGQMIPADVYSSIYAGADKQHYEQVVYGRENATGLHPFVQSSKGVEIWDMQIKRISGKEAAAWCDRLYRTLPSVVLHSACRSPGIPAQNFVGDGDRHTVSGCNARRQYH
jgi:hypothetical protein